MKNAIICLTEFYFYTVKNDVGFHPGQVAQLGADTAQLKYLIYNLSEQLIFIK